MTVGIVLNTINCSVRIRSRPLRRPFAGLVASSFRRKSVATDSKTLPSVYKEMIGKAHIQSDPHQVEALTELERLRNDLMAQKPPDLSTTSTSMPSSESSDWSWWGLGGLSTETTTQENTLKGVYLHGGVGCGKTFCMNLFYDSITETCFWPKQKVHFHKFMLRVHQEMHAARGKGDADAIMPTVVASVAARGSLICLDEFQVTDVADALILQRLFTGLWDKGCVLVATSNRPPQDLYLNGLQRARFLPFIDLLRENCNVVSMDDSEIDYRLVQRLESGSVPVYFTNEASEKKSFDKLFYELVGSSAVAPTQLETSGRRIMVPQATLKRGICRFDFADICKKAMGAADYLVIGQSFDTVFVENVPLLTLNEINWIRRFITFVDSMYESNVKLILQCARPVHELLQVDKRETEAAHDEIFAFDRTVSRLMEMSSESYLKRKWKSYSSDNPAAMLSQSRAKVSVQPSLGDSRERRQ